MRNLPKARVARLVECHKKQKAGYNQRTSPNLRNTTPIINILTPTKNQNFPNTTLILNVLVQMKNNAKSDYSIKFVDKALTYISKHADLNEPEQVKQFIASKTVSNGYKKGLCIAYNKYCKHYGIQWQMPFYTPEAKVKDSDQRKT
jgi:hypothetical protein